MVRPTRRQCVLATREVSLSRRVPRVLTTISMALALSASFGVASVSAAPLPSGQVMIGNTSLVTIPGTPPSVKFTGGGGVVEPAIDDANGNTCLLYTSPSPR